MSALSRINPNIPSSSLEDAIRKLVMHRSPNLFTDNHLFHRMLTDGIDVEVVSQDGEIRHEQVWLFDFSMPENNNWVAVSQLQL